MEDRPKKNVRMLSIGEFGAATQLTPKALRLYAESDLLRPASISPAGYRYYAAEQVSTGRLIRSLRDMNLPLQQIGQVLQAGQFEGELLLTQFLKDAEIRYARERRAYQAALLTLRNSRPRDQIVIQEQSCEPQLVSIWMFAADRTTFVERYLESASLAAGRLTDIGIEPLSPAWCSLIEPLTDEEGPLELLVPISERSELRATGITTRLLPRMTYASVPLPSVDAETITAALDGIFDWFDRRGASVIGPPQLALTSADNPLQPIVRWSFAPSKRGDL